VTCAVRAAAALAASSRTPRLASRAMKMAQIPAAHAMRAPPVATWMGARPIERGGAIEGRIDVLVGAMLGSVAALGGVGVGVDDAACSSALGSRCAVPVGMAGG
jgi:hypothetical protein